MLVRKTDYYTYNDRDPVLRQGLPSSNYILGISSSSIMEHVIKSKTLRASLEHIKFLRLPSELKIRSSISENDIVFEVTPSLNIELPVAVSVTMSYYRKGQLHKPTSNLSMINRGLDL